MPRATKKAKPMNSKVEVKEEKVSPSTSFQPDAERKKVPFPTEVESEGFPADSVYVIWSNVFEKLEQKDKVEFSLAFPEWHKWTAEKRIKTSFPEFAQLLMRELPTPRFLAQRKLCKEWTQMIDHELELDPYQLSNAGNFNKKGYSNDFTSSESIRDFLRVMNTHPGNPFPGRSIRVEFPFYQEMEIEDRLNPQNSLEYWNAVEELLDQFGTHVHHAKISYLNIPGFQMNVKLGNILDRLPNLRFLHIDGISRFDFGVESPRSLPQLPFLETLVTGVIDPSMVDQIYTDCCVPEKMKEIYLCEPKLRPNVRTMLFSFVNLTVLKVSLDMADLNRLAAAPRPQIKKLSLNLLDRGVKLQRIFSVLEPFGNTLVDLRLKSIGNMPRAGVLGDWKINLPNLEELKFSEFRGSVDPLLELKSLRSLNIECYTHVESLLSKQNKVKLHGFEREMYKSNIWDLIPTLTFLAVNKIEYERCIFLKLKATLVD